MTALRHRCTEAACPYLGQPSPRGCGCHKSDEQMLRESHAELLAAVQAIMCADCESVHVGYDERGNYRYVDAVRTDDDAFIAARAAIARAKGGAS